MKVLTGIQPTNLLHIGNLFGALLPAVTLQRDNKLLMMVADYHAITVRQDTMVLRDNILFITAAYLAAGIDPKKTILFQQSRVSAHAELGWIMQTQARMGETARMTQFKDKSGGQEDSVSVGLFTYPILQAADILLYQTEGVPVGEDQKQHIEFTRDLAERFNKHFG
ncbi:tryptophan--tRNA ligase, partial [Patescibacteria group bacterium]|nr:tryptophan--tRNA ligase [Patescibacteria group bacterium]